MTASPRINEFAAGQNILSYFVLRKKEMCLKRDSDELYVRVELGDNSGRIKGSIWDDVKNIFDRLTIGDVVKVKAAVVHIGERNYLNIDQIRPAGKNDNYKLENLIPVAQTERSEMLNNLDGLIGSIENHFLRQLLEAIFNDAAIRKTFSEVPAGKLWHHGYLGGLIEHTPSVTRIADDIAKNYAGTDRDLLVSAGLLHDIGKIKTYSYNPLIDYTDEGRLVGHIVLGADLVSRKISELDGFPESLRTELLHLILSHQGKLEHASPVVPMTLEGLILYYADEIDSKANAFLRIKNREKRPGKNWSSYINLMNQYFYLGSDDDD